MQSNSDEFRTLEEQTYQRLLESMLSGEFSPGTKLVSSSLAAAYRVSRITVSNALKRLASEGFVQARPHREAIVATLDIDDLREIFLIRHALEDIVLTEAANKVTPAIIAELRRLDAAIRQSLEQNDAVAYRTIEREFHMQVYSASELRLVSTTLMDLWNRLEPYRSRRHSKMGLVLDSMADRASIIDALEQQDGEAAALAMCRHVDRGYERMLETMQGRSATSVSRNSAKHPTQSFAPHADSLVSAFEILPDARRSQGRVYPQSRSLALIVLAMLCGARSRSELARWGQECHPSIRAAIGLTTQSAPSSPTIHRLMNHLDSQMLSESFRIWLSQGGFVVESGDLATVVGQVAQLMQTSEDESWQHVPELALAGSSGASNLRLAISELTIAITN